MDVKVSVEFEYGNGVVVQYSGDVGDGQHAIKLARAIYDRTCAEMNIFCENLKQHNFKRSTVLDKTMSRLKRCQEDNQKLADENKRLRDTIDKMTAAAMVEAANQRKAEKPSAYDIAREQAEFLFGDKSYLISVDNVATLAATFNQARKYAVDGARVSGRSACVYKLVGRVENDVQYRNVELSDGPQD